MSSLCESDAGLQVIFSYMYLVKSADQNCVFNGRRHAALPPGESGASSRDDPQGGAEGEAGHCQKDAALLSDLSAGVTGGRRKDYGARGHNCPKLVGLLHHGSSG